VRRVPLGGLEIPRQQREAQESIQNKILASTSVDHFDRHIDIQVFTV
jgi:hypothetical protein